MQSHTRRARLIVPLTQLQYQKQRWESLLPSFCECGSSKNKNTQKAPELNQNSVEATLSLSKRLMNGCGVAFYCCISVKPKKKNGVEATSPRRTMRGRKKEKESDERDVKERTNFERERVCVNAMKIPFVPPLLNSVFSFWFKERRVSTFKTPLLRHDCTVFPLTIHVVGHVQLFGGTLWVSIFFSQLPKCSCRIEERKTHDTLLRNRDMKTIAIMQKNEKKNRKRRRADILFCARFLSVALLLRVHPLHV